MHHFASLRLDSLLELFKVTICNYKTTAVSSCREDDG